MKRILAAVVTVSIATTLVMPSAEAATPAAKRYASCSALNKAFPNGIARSGAASRVAAAEGFAEPRVSRALYNANEHLDRDDDLVACERKATAKPTLPAEPVGYWIPTGVPLVDAILGTEAQTGKITQAQANYLWALITTFTKNPVYCTQWKYEAFRNSVIAVAVAPDKLTENGIDPATAPDIQQKITVFIPVACAGIGFPTGT